MVFVAVQRRAVVQSSLVLANSIRSSSERFCGRHSVPAAAFSCRRSLMPASASSVSIIRRRPFLAAGVMAAALTTTAHAFGSSSVSTRHFLFTPKIEEHRPKLILIGGCTGTGKSTFGMSVALDQDILRCISTDTVRAVMRSFILQDISPALHRSSYTPSGAGDDPVRSWRETCTVLENSVEGLVDDAIRRGVSLVVEGVHVVPGNELIQKWEESGGVAVGCLLTIKDADAHKALLYRRGEITKKGEKKKIQAFDRVRAIQEEMIRLAQESNWLLIEQKLEPDPLEMVASRLYGEAISSASGAPEMEEAMSGMIEEQMSGEIDEEMTEFDEEVTLEAEEDFKTSEEVTLDVEEDTKASEEVTFDVEEDMKTRDDDDDDGDDESPVSQ